MVWRHPLPQGALRMAEEQARKGTDAAESCSEWYAHDCAVLFDNVVPNDKPKQKCLFQAQKHPQVGRRGGSR